MKGFIRCMIIFILIVNNVGIFAQEDEDGNIPYLSDEDIAAMEIVLKDDPVEISETAAENTTAPADKISGPDTSRPERGFGCLFSISIINDSMPIV